MAISNGVQCPQLNSGLGTSHGWLSSMWIERSDTLIHALGYNTTLFAGQSEGWYVLILVPKKLEDLETFNAVLQRGARVGSWPAIGDGGVSELGLSCVREALELPHNSLISHNYLAVRGW